MEAHQQQQQQTQRELDKLRTIDAKVKQVQDKTTSRLPNQYAHMAAMVCGVTWYTRMRLAKMRQHEQRALYDQIVKKMRMELGAFDYQTKEQGELLTRYLCELDNILSFGNAEVKEARKALVVFIQSLVVTADVLSAKSAKLKEFGEQMIARLQVCCSAASKPETTSSGATQSNQNPSKMDETVEEDVVIAHDAEASEEEENEDSDNDEAEEDWLLVDLDNEQVDQANQQPSQQHNEGDEGDDKENKREYRDENCDESVMTDATETESRRLPGDNIDARSLRVWRPYYQIQKRRDGVYLVANLRGIDRNDLSVQLNEYTGVLRISGTKRLTHNEIVMPRCSGVPASGHFEIAERFPANLLNMDEASLALGKDGTLEVRMPYCLVRRPYFVL
ncbi:Bag domain, partial [Globisporangium splendens]